MAISLIQAIAGTVSANSSTVKGTLLSNTTGGNTLIAFIGINDLSTLGSNISGISDTQSNIWTRACDTGETTTIPGASIWYASNITGGSTVITGTVIGANPAPCMIVREYSGLLKSSALDITGTTLNTTAGTNCDLGTLSTTNQGSELIVAIAAVGNTTISGSNGGFGNLGTAKSPVAGQISYIGVLDKILSSTGTVTGTAFLASSVKSAGAIASFKAIINGAGTNLIQSSGTAVLGLGSTSVTWGANTTTGDLIVVGVNLTNAAALGTVSSVVDSQGNLYTRAIRGTISSLGDVLNTEIWYASNIVGGAGSVTVNHTVDNCAMFAREYSGYNTLDVTNAANGSSATPNTGTVNTNFANELVVVATGDDKGPTQTWTAAGTYGDMVGTATTITGLSMEDALQVGTAAQTGTLTLGAAANWEALMATFYQSTGVVGYMTLLGAGQI